MADVGKIAVGALSAAAGFIAMTLWAPFGGKFDYASASVDEKQKYLETKARNFSRGFRLTAGGASEISGTYVDAESDLLSFTVQLKGPATAGHIPASELETARSLMMKTACTLTERDLLTETPFRLRIRFFKPDGGNLLTVEANGETCAPYFG